jgi:hypothetical protein
MAVGRVARSCEVGCIEALHGKFAQNRAKSRPKEAKVVHWNNYPVDR